MASYPDVIAPSLIGKYPANTFSGGGYFYDHILEYRVWCHPELGAPDEYDGDDYYYCFATYNDALSFHQRTKGSEKPLVLIKQFEWIDEPSPGQFIHKHGERITEWLPEWLIDSLRDHDSIPNFIAQNSVES
jgi:hypothetical protein